METLYTVELPLRRHPSLPKFPDACVGCSAEDPEYGIEARHRPERRSGILGWLIVPDWMIFRKAAREEVKEAPACAECPDEHDSHVRTARWLGFALTAILIGAAYWLYTSVDLPNGVPKRAVILLGFLLVPLIVHLIYRIAPPLFAIYAGERTVQYQFLNDDYATQFRRANAQRKPRDGESAPKAGRRR